MMEDGKAELESLRDELQDWYNSLPENLQQGGKADELQAAVSELEDMISNAEDLTGSDVNFPGMY